MTGQPSLCCSLEAACDSCWLEEFIHLKWTPSNFMCRVWSRYAFQSASRLYLLTDFFGVLHSKSVQQQNSGRTKTEKGTSMNKSKHLGWANYKTWGTKTIGFGILHKIGKTQKTKTQLGKKRLTQQQKANWVKTVHPTFIPPFSFSQLGVFHTAIPPKAVVNSWNTFDAWAALRRRRPVSSWPRPVGVRFRGKTWEK